ncbi:DUF1398 domain-containing protein [Xanthobacter flavus]|uniref:DUF1398 domain-containing protein n=1 Tax=Xanthobacter flavus TaxID=281 RepID=UPI001AEB641B|nr:DUF1398 family protein [Xanthobacter flavus]MBP2149479.1 uncharacterized protein YbcV (DUF1398 family) [Xanthobacter flavus]
MTEEQTAAARACLAAAESDTATFPAIVGALVAAGFEGYAVDFRRAAATYYLPSGDSLELPTHKAATAIAPALDDAGLTAAIREAQQQAPGYTYRGFCEKAAAAGCAGYIVSFPGRRAVYFARTGQTHVELFPGS